VVHTEALHGGANATEVGYKLPNLDAVLNVCLNGNVNLFREQLSHH
jgi:hypothetical protein